MVSQSKFLYKKTLNRIAFMLTASVLVNMILSILLVTFNSAAMFLENETLIEVLKKVFEILFYLGFYYLTLLAFKTISTDADDEFILQKPKEITKVNFIRPILYCLIIIGVINFVGTLNEYFLTNFTSDKTSEMLSSKESTTIIGLLLSVISTAILPGIFEELIFRNIICKKLMIYGEGFALVVSSLLFGFWHGNFYQIPYAICGGFILGLIYIKTQKIIYSMLAHFANNLFSVIATYFAQNLDNRQYFIYDIVLLIITSVLATASIVYILLTHKKYTVKTEEEQNIEYEFLSKKSLIGGIFTSGVILFLLACIAESVIISLNIGGFYG